jgi:hypothetical protein
MYGLSASSRYSISTICCSEKLYSLRREFVVLNPPRLGSTYSPHLASKYRDSESTIAYCNIRGAQYDGLRDTAARGVHRHRRTWCRRSSPHRCRCASHRATLFLELHRKHYESDLVGILATPACEHAHRHILPLYDHTLESHGQVERESRLEAQSPPSTGLHEDRPGSDFAERRILGANLRKRIARGRWNSNHVIGLE